MCVPMMHSCFSSAKVRIRCVAKWLGPSLQSLVTTLLVGSIPARAVFFAANLDYLHLSNPDNNLTGANISLCTLCGLNSEMK